MASHQPRGTASRSSGRRKGKIPENEGSTTTSTKETETTVSKPKRSSPTAKYFRTEVLAPRRITIEAPPPVEVDEHFRVAPPSSDLTRIEHFRTIRHIEHTIVFLEPTKDFIEDINREFTCMQYDGDNEAEFASYALEAIFKRDPRSPAHTYDNSSRGWRTKRCLQLVDKPSDTDATAFWRPPPLLSSSSDAAGVILPADSASQSGSVLKTSETQYEFDIRTDCAYYLSIQGFNTRIMSQTKAVAHVNRRSFTCPYLTIEFKKDGSTHEAVENQLVTAAALALFNRFLLRQTRLQRKQQVWREGQHGKVLKHYGITFEGAQFSIWCINPRLIVTDAGAQVQWKGCTMTQVSQGTCISYWDVERLIDWINEIHAWGLSSHAFGVENDIKFLLGATAVGGPRMSAVNEDLLVDEESLDESRR